MATLLLEPEFLLDLDSTIQTGPILIEDGLVKSIGETPQVRPDQRLLLKNQVVMPGFVNGHSHSFQRALRGLVEKVEAQKNDSFWSWREYMYAIANNLLPDDLSLVSKLCYLEMLEAGFTHVGEFHYLHHDVQGPFKDPLLMSQTLAQAAYQVGINLILLECAYNRYSFSTALKNSQARFAHQNVESFLSLAKNALKLSGPNISLGLAIHSVRAVPDDWFKSINDLAKSEKLPLHIHVSEQVQEVRDCLEHYGCSPIKLLAKNHLLSQTTTLIHATHLIDDDIQLIDKLKPNLCLCPSTEKNLGDGMLPLKELSPDLSVCIGTDQHVRMDPFDEVRSLEEQERLRLNQRGIFSKNGFHLYEALHPYLTLGGLRSLYPYQNHQSIVGQRANLISLELPPEYYWHGPQIALDAMMLSYNPSKITNVLSNGHFVVQDKEPVNREKPYIIKHLKEFFKRVL